MPCSATMIVELAPEVGMSQMEQAIQACGRQARRQALQQAVRGYERRIWYAHTVATHTVRAGVRAHGRC